jgi:hypothetical protein
VSGWGAEALIDAIGKICHIDQTKRGIPDLLVVQVAKKNTMFGSKLKLLGIIRSKIWPHSTPNTRKKA